MKYVSKSDLKDKMLLIFRDVEATREPIIVTSHRKPVLKISPYFEDERVEDVFADVRGKVSLPDDEDLNAPIDDVWEAL